MFEPDYTLIAIVIFSLTMVMLVTFKFRHDIKEYKFGIPFIIGGLLFPLASLIATCVIEKSWDINFITSFFLLKEVSKQSSFQILCSIGYIFLACGTMIFLFFSINKQNYKKQYDL